MSDATSNDHGSDAPCVTSSEEFERSLTALLSSACENGVSVEGAWDVETPEECSNVTIEIWNLTD